MVDARLAGIDTFLQRAGWADALRAALAGDASARRYFRLTRDGQSAVLMDADPARGESLTAFLAVGGWLRAQGYSAPEVLAADEGAGFLLLEDFGDTLFARVIADDPDRAPALYRLATGFLADLHDRPPPDFVATADGAALADLVRLLADHYLPAAGAAPEGADRVADLIAALYDRWNDRPAVLSLRDFHAENLIHLPDRPGLRQAGLLDFQDAFATHPAYDLVSLLQDARRDVSPATEAACLQDYMTQKGLEESRFSAIYALLGVQRALRIIAVFARLAQRDGKAQYLAYMPRVWGYLQRNLSHPALADLAGAVLACVPAPDPDLLARLAKPGQRPKALMLFAAGLGTRMRPLTDDRPKPLVTVGGRALIDHALDQARGVARTVINLHYRADQMRAHLAGRAGIVFSDESARLLETGGGLKQALPHLGAEPVFVLNSDAVWTGANALDQLAAVWDPARMDALLLLVPRDRAVGHTGPGDFVIGPDGRLRRGPGLVYTGAQIIGTGRVADWPGDVFSLNPVWDQMAAEGRLFGTVHAGGWCDVGRPDCIPLAEAMLTDV